MYALGELNKLTALATIKWSINVHPFSKPFYKSWTSQHNGCKQPWPVKLQNKYLNLHKRRGQDRLDTVLADEKISQTSSINLTAPLEPFGFTIISYLSHFISEQNFVFLRYYNYFHTFVTWYKLLTFALRKKKFKFFVQFGYISVHQWCLSCCAPWLGVLVKTKLGYN